MELGNSFCFKFLYIFQDFKCEELWLFGVFLAFGVFLLVSVETSVASVYASLVWSRLLDSEKENCALC